MQWSPFCRDVRVFWISDFYALQKKNIFRLLMHWKAHLSSHFSQIIADFFRLFFTDALTPLMLLLWCTCISLSWLIYLMMNLWLFSHDGKVRILNFNLKCASWIKIRKTVFWTVCTPNHVEMRNLKCAFQITVLRCFRVTHLANHAAKSLYEWLDL